MRQIVWLTVGTWTNFVLLKQLSMRWKRHDHVNGITAFCIGTPLGVLIDKRTHQMFLNYFLIPKCLEVISGGLMIRGLLSRRLNNDVIMPVVKASTLGFLALTIFSSAPSA